MTITSPFTAADGALAWVGDGETVRIETWGANSIPVRARFMQPIADADWALLPPPADAPAPTIAIAEDGISASLTNGDITVTARMPRWDGRCELTFTKADGTVVGFDAVVRIDTPGEADYYRNGGILQYVLRNLMKR